MADDRVVHSRPELFAAPTHGFAWIRMIGAILVIFGHSSPLVGTGELFPPSWPLQPDEGVLMGFFALSGFQITESWLRDPHPLRFAAKRVLRLWPPMLAVSIGVALIVGPLVTTLSTGEYYSTAGTWSYLLNNAGLLTLQHELPGVFTNNPWPDAVNGSLWTLPMELLAYGGLYTLLLLGAATQRFRWLAVVALVVLVAVDRHLEHAPGPESAGSLLSVPTESLIAFLVAFAIGVVLNLYRIALSPTAAAAGLVVLALMPNSHTGSFWMTIAISYAVIVTGHYWPARLEVPSVWVNGSYGVYVWSFPIQQLLAMAGVGNQFLMLLCAAPIAYVLGTLSWVFIEEPAMRLKNYVAPDSAPRDERDAVEDEWDDEEWDWDDDWADGDWADEAWEADGDLDERPDNAGRGDSPDEPGRPTTVLPRVPRRDGRSVPPPAAPTPSAESAVARRLSGALDPSGPVPAASRPADQPPAPAQQPAPVRPHAPAPARPPTPAGHPADSLPNPQPPVAQPPAPQPASPPPPRPPQTPAQPYAPIPTNSAGLVPGAQSGAAQNGATQNGAQQNGMSQNGGGPAPGAPPQHPVQQPGPPRHRSQPDSGPSGFGQPVPGPQPRRSPEPADRFPVADGRRTNAPPTPSGAHAQPASEDRPTGKHAAVDDREAVPHGEQASALDEGRTRPRIRPHGEYRRP